MENKWKSVDSVPMFLAQELDASDEAYFITDRDLVGFRDMKDALSVFSGDIAVARDESISGYYAFIRR